MFGMSVKLKVEQKLVSVYSLMGLLFGVLSNWMYSTSLALAMILPAAVYFASVVALRKYAKITKVSSIASNTLVTFFLVWIVVWVFLYNL